MMCRRIWLSSVAEQFAIAHMILYTLPMRTIQTTYRYRLEPTAAQASLLNQFAGARRFIWNWGLNRQREHFQQTGKTLSFSVLCTELTSLKQQPALCTRRFGIPIAPISSSSAAGGTLKTKTAPHSSSRKRPIPRAFGCRKMCVLTDRSSRFPRLA